MDRTNRTIPAPIDGRIVQASTRTALAVPAGAAGGCTVIYYCDDRTVTVSLSSGRLDTSDLDTAINTQQLPGRPVVSAELECGGRINRDDLDVTPDESDQAFAIEALPYLHAALREPSERAALRVFYRALAAKADFWLRHDELSALGSD